MFSLPQVESWNPYVLLCPWNHGFYKSIEHYKSPKNPSELMAAHPAHVGFHNTGAHWTKPHWELLSSWDVYQHQQGDMWESMLCKWSWLQSGSRCNHQGHPCPSWGAEIPLGREWKCTDDDPVQKVYKCPAERGRPATLISCCKRWKEIINCPLVLLALTFAYWILHI